MSPTFHPATIFIPAFYDLTLPNGRYLLAWSPRRATIARCARWEVRTSEFGHIIADGLTLAQAIALA